VVLGGDDYPPALAAAPLAPPVLFGRGDPTALRLGVAVVGTRWQHRDVGITVTLASP
jgi:predicted Rossmann fold nucleotide-binding protein DprA/Smf involved in DNA uptake